jgi:hypothetical protein
LAFTFSKSSFRLFSVEIPSWMGFSRPQLTAVPGLLGGNPLMDGIF